MNLRFALPVLAVLCGFSLPAAAQSFAQGLAAGAERGRSLGAEDLSVTLEPFYPRAPVTTHGVAGFYEGENVKVCVLTRQAGYLSIWSKTGPRELDRLYPNPLAQAESARKAGFIRAGVRRCYGDYANRDYVFTAEHPGALVEVYVHFSLDEESHLTHSARPDLSQVAAAPRSLGGGALGGALVAPPQPPPYAAQTLRYRVLPQ